MRNVFLIFLGFGICAAASAQTTIPAGIIGTWKSEKGLTYQFSADGTYTMSVESEAVHRALSGNTPERSENITDSSSDGTFTVSGDKIEMVMRTSDGRTNKATVTFTMINVDTLRLKTRYGLFTSTQDYRREQIGD
jgi:hypothetical protein